MDLLVIRGDYDVLCLQATAGPLFFKARLNGTHLGYHQSIRWLAWITKKCGGIVCRLFALKRKTKGDGTNQSAGRFVAGFAFTTMTKTVGAAASESGRLYSVLAR